jgi:hypothetical protein
MSQSLIIKTTIGSATIFFKRDARERFFSEDLYESTRFIVA